MRDLAAYWSQVIEGRPAEAKLIHPGTVVTSPWVGMKCRYGCAGYGKGYCCPPETPTFEETRKMLECYQRAVLFHYESAKVPGENRLEKLREFFDALVSLEGRYSKTAFIRPLSFWPGLAIFARNAAK
jgi:predicted metal-binding protein